MKEWIPSNVPIEVIEERIRQAEEISAHLSDWPDPDNYVDNEGKKIDRFVMSPIAWDDKGRADRK